MGAEKALGREVAMYEFEMKMKAAEKEGIRFSEGQQTYIRCARINGIDLISHLIDRYSKDQMNEPQDDEESREYLTAISVIMSISEYFDENLCELVDQMIEQNRLDPKRK